MLLVESSISKGPLSTVMSNRKLKSLSSSRSADGEHVIEEDFGTPRGLRETDVFVTKTERADLGMAFLSGVDDELAMETTFIFFLCAWFSSCRKDAARIVLWSTL